MKNMTLGYEIGEKVWFKGDEYAVISEPYLLYGGWFQDATAEDGKVVTIKAKERQG